MGTGTGGVSWLALDRSSGLKASSWADTTPRCGCGSGQRGDEEEICPPPHERSSGSRALALCYDLTGTETSLHCDRSVHQGREYEVEANTCTTHTEPFGCRLP